ncbi:DNA polymerase III subunit delta [Rubellimicrobium roseum]|uniref:DNA-directed DNA polymerase n=1 Tax=Rubellimicrobium roseum TaxID=687525 RepID=A0A5C4NGL7_9RHOB|nr:DNA polymerase III subunit delta [Rubellimicrobium roseum]TNC71797.1 DNA polymerase III subunit delta [Rubellimicrobium roseum]
MKLSSRDGKAFLRKPDPAVAGVLISGEDGARVAQARTELVLALIGPQGEADMRLERIAGADLRRDPSLVIDALKAVGFFPGPRAVLVEEATDGLAPALGAALEAWSKEDARLVVTGGALPSKGALRKLFEGRRDAAAITLYDDPPTEGEVLDLLREAGLRPDPAARAHLVGLAQSLSPGDFRGLVERLALHELGEGRPLDDATVSALAPQAEEAEMDDLLAAITEGRRDRVAPLLARLSAQGMGPVAVTIQALRHVRALLQVASDPGGVQTGLASLRPPAGGARRQMLQRGAETWRRERVEEALRTLVELDLTLRSGRPVPDAAILERVLMRLAG